MATLCLVTGGFVYKLQDGMLPESELCCVCRKIIFLPLFSLCGSKAVILNVALCFSMLQKSYWLVKISVSEEDFLGQSHFLILWTLF